MKGKPAKKRPVLREEESDEDEEDGVRDSQRSDSSECVAIIMYMYDLRRLGWKSYLSLTSPARF